MELPGQNKIAMKGQRGSEGREHPGWLEEPRDGRKAFKDSGASLSLTSPVSLAICSVGEALVLKSVVAIERVLHIYPVAV